MNGAPDHVFSLEQIVAALFAASGINSGLWRLAAKVRFAAITAGFPDEKGILADMPSGMVGIEGLALFSVDEPGPMVFDAAPAPVKKARRGTKTAERQPGRHHAQAKPPTSKTRRGL